MAAAETTSAFEALTRDEAQTLDRARAALDAIAGRLGTSETSASLVEGKQEWETRGDLRSLGRLLESLERAEEAVFQVLNLASSHLHSAPAADALKSYNERR